MADTEQGRILVRDEGTIIMLCPANAEAQEWLDEHVEAEAWQYMGEWLCVDRRMAEPLLEGMQEAGIVLEAG